VTARGQVRDDGQAGASRARGDQRPPQEAGIFAGSRYILPKRPRLVSAWLFGLAAVALA
jgi:hypothetical protein